LGYVKKTDIITGEKIQPGDVIIGLSSNGIHSNGYTLVRNVIKELKLKYTDKFPNEIYSNKKIGDVLLEPTQIYVKEIVNLIKNIKVHGLAHITGGGLRNLSRLNKNVKFVIDDPFTPQPIFKFIQKNGNIDDKEMYRVFNMGMGFSIIVSKKDVNNTINILRKYSKSIVKKVGIIEKGKGVELKTLGIKY
jgi:phosphoribosylformylglycinamidine cyclo-ligase